MITTKTTQYGSKMTTVMPPEKHKYNEFTIRVDGKFIATVSQSDSGKLFICGHNVEVTSDRA